MARSQLVHHLCKLLTMFLFTWPQPCLDSLENKWKSHECTSRGNHTYCKKSLKFLKTKTCEESSLMDFEQWDFMSSSVLLKVFPFPLFKDVFVGNFYCNLRSGASISHILWLPLRSLGKLLILLLKNISRW